VVFIPLWECLECADQVHCDRPYQFVKFHVEHEGGGQHDLKVGTEGVVFVVGGQWVGVVGLVYVVHGQKLLQDSGQEAGRVGEGRIWYQEELRMSWFQYPLFEPVMGVVALAEDVVRDGLTPTSEGVPGSGCSEHLCALGVEREDLNVAKSTWVEELLFVRNGRREFAVGVLGEGKRVGDLVVAWLSLRNFHLELRLEMSTSCDNPLAESCS